MVIKIKQILKKYDLREIIAYLIVGVLTTVINLLIYYLCTELFLDSNKIIQVEIANVIAWIVAVIFAYYANRIVVFRSKNDNVINEGVKFFLGRIFTLLLEILLMALMVSILRINDKVAKLVCQVVIIIGNYIISKLIVFKNKDKK